MEAKLKQVFSELKRILEMVPVTQERSFAIEAVSDGVLTCHGMLDNKYLQMDQLNINASVETRWMIQDKDVDFMIFKGAAALRYRVNGNIHKKHLNTKQSLRIPAGVPFQLKTHETAGSILLISIKGAEE